MNQSMQASKIIQGTFESPYKSFSKYLLSRMHRSNSMSTLPSLCRDDVNERLRCLNRSMHEDIDHNLTYSYSSSEDSLNESFNISPHSFTPKKPRSAQASQVRALYATPNKVRQEAAAGGMSPHARTVPTSPAYPGLAQTSRTVPSSSSYHGGATSTPAKPVLDTSAYLQKMYEDMDKVDKQLELVTRQENTKPEMTRFDEEDDEMEEGETMEVDGVKDDNEDKLKKMEEMMKDLNQQSEEIQKMFRFVRSDPFDLDTQIVLFQKVDCQETFSQRFRALRIWL